MRTRRLLSGLVGLLLVLAVAVGWTALRPDAVRPDPLPAPIRIGEPGPMDTGQGPGPAVLPSATVAPPVDPQVVPPPPLPGQSGDDDLDDDGGDEDSDVDGDDGG